MNKPRIKKTITIIIVALAVAVTGYLLTLTAQLTTGVSAMAPPPAHSVRLQVLTVDDATATAKKIAGEVEGLADEALAIDVVEVDRYDLRSVTRTMIISRLEDKTSAEHLAVRLGLDPSEVTYKPLEHNRRQVTATLVAGPDFDSVLSALESTKELQRQS